MANFQLRMQSITHIDGIADEKRTNLDLTDVSEENVGRIIDGVLSFMDVGRFAVESIYAMGNPQACRGSASSDANGSFFVADTEYTHITVGKRN